MCLNRAVGGADAGRRRVQQAVERVDEAVIAWTVITPAEYDTNPWSSPRCGGKMVLPMQVGPIHDLLDVRDEAGPRAV